MSRWRPPSPGSSPYITRNGFLALEKELEALWKKRTEVTSALSAAAAEGDRSENAEYIYRKKQLREIDGRVTYLQRRMPKLKIVDQVGDRDRVFFSAIVHIEDEKGNESMYRIVGADEIDAEERNISIDSPMGKALLGKSVDDAFTLDQNGTDIEFCITKIEYRE